MTRKQISENYEKACQHIISKTVQCDREVKYVPRTSPLLEPAINESVKMYKVNRNHLLTILELQ